MSCDECAGTNDYHDPICSQYASKSAANTCYAQEPRKIALTFESLVALIQGKKLHIQLGGERRLTLVPPGDGVYLTHEELTDLRTQEYHRAFDTMRTLSEHHLKA
jgi:hypothetical protein